MSLQVINELRQSGLTFKEIARRYGVSPAYLYEVRHGRNKLPALETEGPVIPYLSQIEDLVCPITGLKN